jgi:hypothetical protein
LPPAALVAITAFSAHEVQPAAAAEGAYLGRLAAAVLVAVAVLAPPPAAELGLGAALAAAAVWALPAGPGRGAAALALLAATLAVATARRLRGLDGGVHGDLTQLASHDDVGATASRGGEGPGFPAPPAGGDDGKDGARLAASIALCFGWQTLLRGELWLAPGHAARPWAALVVLPVVAGVALALLWRHRGALPALAAAGAAAVLAPGWTVATTLALVALAGGDSLATAGAATAGGDRRAADQHNGDLSGRWPAAVRRAAAVATLLAPVAWQPRSGWAAALAGLALARPGMAAGLALPLAILTRGLALPAFGALGAAASWRQGASGIAWLVMLVPAALLAAPRPGRRAFVAVAALLAFATPWLPDRSALAAPLALAALALPGEGAAAGLASVWSAAVVAGTALLASYPWLRRDPAAEALALLGARPGLLLAAAIGGATLLLGAGIGLALRRRGRLLPRGLPGGRWPGLPGGLWPGLPGGRWRGLPGGLWRGLQGGWPRGRQGELPRGRPGELPRIGAGAVEASVESRASSPAARPPGAGAARIAPGVAGAGAARIAPGVAGVRAARIAAGVAGAALFVALVAPQLVSPGIALLTPGDSVLLDRSHPSWHTDIAPGWRSSGLALQSSLSNAAGLAPGTAVARVRLLGGDAAVELVLRSGQDTGEWAARRPDVAAAAPGTAPSPWLAWVAGEFFGQRYRARLPLPRPGSYARVEIDLDSGLPAGAGLALHQVELDR